MRGFLRITKLLLGMTFRKNLPGKRGGKMTLTGCVIAAAIISAFIAVALGLLGYFTRGLGFETAMTGMLLAVDFLLTLVFGTVAVMSQMYFSRDGEFFISLPVSSNTVLFAKLFVVYVEEAIVSAVLMLPGAIVFGIVAAQSAAYYVMAIVAVAFVPLAAVLLAAIISVPLTFVAGFFRNRGAVAGVLMLVLFAAVMTLYMVFANVFAPSVADDAVTDPEQALAAVRQTLEHTLYVFYPLLALARFGTLSGGLIADNVAASAAVDLAIFFGSVVLLAAVLLPISALMYGRAMLRQSEHGGGAVKKGEYVSSGLLGSLVKKEFRMLLRNASFSFQCLAGCVLAPLMSIFMIVMGGIESAEVNVAGQTIETDLTMIFAIMWPCAVFMVLLMTAGMNISALTAITREGKTFVYSKLIPVPYRTQLMAKRISAIVPASISALVSLVGISVTGGFVLGVVDPLAIISALLLFAAAILCSTEFYLYRDLKKPRLDWNTPRDAVKNNPATILPMLAGMGVSMLCGVALVLSGILLYMAGWEMNGISLVSVLLAAALVGLFFVANTRMSLNCEKHYDSLYI